MPEPTPIPTPPPVVSDDWPRQILGLAVIVQFLALVGYMIYVGKPMDNTQMILGAEIGFVSSVLNYYFGSSSGSTAKSAMLEKGTPSVTVTPQPDATTTTTTTTQPPKP